MRATVRLAEARTPPAVPKRITALLLTLMIAALVVYAFVDSSRGSAVTSRLGTDLFSSKALATSILSAQKIDLHKKPRSDENWAKLSEGVRCLNGGFCNCSNTGVCSVDDVLDNADQVEYYGNVYIGTPPQKFEICFDTGSGTLWVASSTCTTTACSNRVKFDSSESSTFTSSGTPESMNYGIGSAYGILGYDVVSIGPLNGTSREPGDLVVDSQGFMLADSLEGGTFTQTVFDGVMGLATGAEIATPWYRNLIDQGGLPLPIFSLFYSNTDSMPGQIVFGGVDPALYTGDITWHPAGSDDPFYWTTYIDSIEVSGTTIWNCESGGCQAMIDSGTSLIVAPPSMVPASLTSSSDFTAESDCSNLDGMASVTFNLQTVGGGVKAYTFEPRDYVMKRGGECSTGMTTGASGSTDGTIILGDVFIRKYLTIFNAQPGANEGRLGFALANQAGNMKSASSRKCGYATAIFVFIVGIAMCYSSWSA